jgi:hypothetical protein
MTEGLRLTPAGLRDFNRFVPSLFRVSCLLSPVSHLLAFLRRQNECPMTDLREKTFRLTQFARCAG